MAGQLTLSLSPDADITRGIEQAHARCAEANLGYIAAPIQSVTGTARTLARDLNVGILGGHDLDTVECVEPARATGAGDFTRDIQAIRFQASTHRLTDRESVAGDGNHARHSEIHGRLVTRVRSSHRDSPAGRSRPRRISLPERPTV